MTCSLMLSIAPEGTYHSEGADCDSAGGNNCEICPTEVADNVHTDHEEKGIQHYGKDTAINTQDGEVIAKQHDVPMTMREEKIRGSGAIKVSGKSLMSFQTVLESQENVAEGTNIEQLKVRHGEEMLRKVFKELNAKLVLHPP